MIWSGKKVAEYIEDVEEDMIQPNGVDLRIGEIFLVESFGNRNWNFRWIRDGEERTE